MRVRRVDGPRTRWRCAGTLGALLLGVAAHAEVIGLPAMRDNTLYEDPTGSRSNGAGTAMFAGRNSQSSDSIRRAVLAFDIAGAIPAGSRIDRVTLTLSNAAANSDPADVRLHRLLSDWGEGASAAGDGGGGGGAPAAPGDATWVHTFYDDAFWSTPGGDFDSLFSTAESVSGAGTYTWPSTPRLVADVQAMLDSPASNFGWILIGDEAAPSTAKRFATREAVDPASRPLLTVDYTPVPEPSTAACFLAAVLWTLRRFRAGQAKRDGDGYGS